MSTKDSVGDCPSNSEGDLTSRDQRYMREALAMARRAQNRTWPNPPVGAVVVKGERIVGRGTHEGCGQPHAEPGALQEAGEQACGATLYVTLEPCNHQGRTPPCAPAVFAAGIKRVVVGMRDPNPSVGGGGCRYLRDRGVEVVCGVLAEECLELVWPFVATDNFTRPYVELKTAVSLDGRFAPDPAPRSAAQPVYLTGPVARHDVHLRRRRVDLVLVGKGTALADRPRLDGRMVTCSDLVPASDPRAGYVDTHLECAGGLDAPAFMIFAGQSAQDNPRRQALEKLGADIVFCREKEGRVDPHSLVEQAAQRGLLTLMVEGGPTLAGSFLAHELVDRWLAYTAPVVLGRGVSWATADHEPIDQHLSFQLTRTEVLDRDLLAVYDQRDFAVVLGQITI